jgi:23S rRNA pseudouridine2605 synthase
LPIEDRRFIVDRQLTIDNESGNAAILDTAMRLPSRPTGHVALERALSKLGLASRTEARALIQAGRVEVDGRSVKNPRVLVVPGRVRLSIDGERLNRAPWRLLLLHKPRGVVTTKRDPRQRRTVYDSLRASGNAWIERLVPVGRLDLASTGLLLLTSDTRLADWLTDPRNGIVRRYVVTIRGALGPDAETKITPVATLRILKRSRRETHLIVELTEGKNREIRRMFEADRPRGDAPDTDRVRWPRARKSSTGPMAGSLAGRVPRGLSPAATRQGLRTRD